MKRFLLLATLMLFTVPAMAQVNLAWDPYSDAAAITGFKAYMSKTSMVYSPTPVATFIGGALVAGSVPKPTSFGRYYFVLIAYYTDPAVPSVTYESDYSNEVSTVIKPKAPKLNTAQQVAQAVGKAVTKMAGVFKPHKNLKIIED